MDKIDKITNYSTYKRFISSMSSEEKDSLGDDPTSCWLYAYFVHKTLNFAVDDRSHDVVYENHGELNLDCDGIYTCLMDCDAEFHHFILIIEKDVLTLLATYGGQRGLIWTKMDKVFWITHFKKLIDIDNHDTDKIDIYKMLFGIRKTYFDTTSLTNFKLEFTYHEIK